MPCHHLQEHLEGERVDAARHRVSGSSPVTPTRVDPAASTRVRRSRSVRMPASRSPSMTRSEATPCPTTAASPADVVVDATGRRPTIPRTRVLRMAFPVEDS